MTTSFNTPLDPKTFLDAEAKGFHEDLGAKMTRTYHDQIPGTYTDKIVANRTFDRSKIPADGGRNFAQDLTINTPGGGGGSIGQGRYDDRARTKDAIWITAPKGTNVLSVEMIRAFKKASGLGDPHNEKDNSWFETVKKRAKDYTPPPRPSDHFSDTPYSIPDSQKETFQGHGNEVSVTPAQLDYIRKFVPRIGSIKPAFLKDKK